MADEVVAEGVGDLVPVLTIQFVQDLGVGLVSVDDEVCGVSAFGFLRAVTLGVVLETDAADGQAAGDVGDGGEFGAVIRVSGALRNKKRFK